MDTYDKETAHAADLARVLGPFAKAILVDVPEGRFVVPVEDMQIGLDLRYAGSYSPQELDMLRALCTRQTRLLVVGAHIGALAIPLARICRSVTAIEANPHTFELLKINLELNRCQNCRIIHVAASNKEEMIPFVLNRVNSGGSKRMPLVKNQAYFHDNPTIVDVPAAPLDDLLSGESFDIVLMDIEGSEYFALKGMQRILASTKVLQVEFLPHHLQNVAGVTVLEFLRPIRPHFTAMALLNQRLAVGPERFEGVLASLFVSGQGCEGITFLKTAPEAVRFE